ncbi:hypothetical protein EV424DRAFT_1437250 [Suillus variegatus]|nr:hypothetical protein EV424DRAFT_1437250 [Suillus variegatus]
MWIQLLAVVICSLPWVRVVTNNISSSTSALCPQPTRPPSFSAINLPFFPLPLSDLSFPSPKATFLGLELTPADESGPWRLERSLDLPKQQYLSANQPTTSESYKGMRRLNSYIYMPCFHCLALQRQNGWKLCRKRGCLVLAVNVCQ